MMDEMIIIDGVSKEYGELKVLKDIHLHIQKGAICGIIGQSGAGKSTLLRCINGLEKFDSGKILIDGVDISIENERAVRNIRREIGMVFQNFSLLERLNVYENIAFPMKSWGYSKKEIDQRVKELIGLVELTDKMDAYPKHLSGGQKQRVAIARALTMEPKILLCDEATSALDPKTSESILKLLKDINDKTGITIIVVAHQLSVIRDICTHMAILENGYLANSGKTIEVFVNEPAALRRLQAYKSNEANLSIVFQKNHSIELSQMIRDLNLDVNIIDMQHIGIDKKTVHYTVHVPNEKLETCMEWLEKKKIYASRLKGMEQIDA